MSAGRFRRVIEMPPPAPVRREVERLRRLEPPVDLLDAVMADVQATPQTRAYFLPPLALGGLASLAAAAALVVAVSLWSNRDVGVPDPAESASASPSPTAQATGDPGDPGGTPAVDALPRAGVVGMTVEVERDTRLGAAGFGSIWLAHPLDGSVSRVDPTTLETVSRIQVRPRDPRGMPMPIHADADAVWVAGDGRESTLVRIDPETSEVVGVLSVADTAAPFAFDIDGDTVWFTPTGQPRIVAARVSDGAVLHDIERQGASGIQVAFGSVWVSDYGGAGILRIDPRSGAVVDEIAGVGFESTVVMATDHALWIAGSDGYTVTRIDPDSLEHVTGPRSLRGIGFIGDEAWGALPYGRVGPLDPMTLDLRAVVVTGADEIREWKAMAGLGSFWVVGETFADAAVRLYRVDPGPP